MGPRTGLGSLVYLDDGDGWLVQLAKYFSSLGRIKYADNQTIRRCGRKRWLPVRLHRKYACVVDTEDGSFWIQ